MHYSICLIFFGYGFSIISIFNEQIKQKIILYKFILAQSFHLIFLYVFLFHIVT